LPVDLREAIDWITLLNLRKPRDKKLNKRVPVEYSIVLELEGEKVEYLLYFYDVVKKAEFSLRLASGRVDLTTLQELGQCPRRNPGAERHTQTDSSDEASSDNYQLDESITSCLNLTRAERAQQQEEERLQRRHQFSQDALDEGHSIFEGPESDSTLAHESLPRVGMKRRRGQQFSRHKVPVSF
jgi:hypothetical protein